MKSLAQWILILLTLQSAPHAFGKNAARLTNISMPAAVSSPQSSQPSTTTPDAAAPVTSPPTSEKKVTAYTLPPDLYRKARDLGRFHARFAWIDFFYGIFVLWVILSWRFGPQFRDWAESVSRNRFVQAAVFAPLLLLTMAILGLPSAIYENSVERKYGLSIQSWGSWFWDWTKGQFLGILLGIILVSILYAVIRSSPRRWWVYFWLVSLPIAVILVFIQPLIVDPMFHKFEPLQQKDPALTASLETMVSAPA
jgi:STE24 endopeptidase